MKILSQIDVITNSSTEVFIFNMDSPEYQEVKQQLGHITEINTIDDVWDLLFKEGYYYESRLDELLYADHGTWSEDEIPNILDPVSSINDESVFSSHEEFLKERREMWERHKSNYSFFVGKAVLEFQDNYCTGEYLDLLTSITNKIGTRKFISYLEKLKEDYKKESFLMETTLSPFNQNVLVNIKWINGSIKFSLCSINRFGFYSDNVYIRPIRYVNKLKPHTKIEDEFKTTIVKFETENHKIIDIIPYYFLSYHNRLDLMVENSIETIIPDLIKLLPDNKICKVINYKTSDIYDQLENFIKISKF